MASNEMYPNPYKVVDTGKTTDGKVLEGLDLFGDATVMKRVIKAAPKENTESPQAGHKVKVHYVGTLTLDGT